MTRIPAVPSVARFAVLWAFALLYHQAGYRTAFSTPLDSALTLAAAATMLLPGSVPLLGVLSGLQLLVVVQRLPAVYNHWYFAGLVSLSLLTAAIVAVRHSRQAGTPPSGALSEAFGPAARACLLLLYLLSGFHKLNHDFLTPGISCGSVMFEALGSRLGLPVDWAPLGAAAIGLTLAVELGAPVLLLFARTRGVGVVVALLFHLAMALAGYARFSAASVALLTLFLPDDTPGWFLAMRTRILATAVLMTGTLLGPSVADPLFLATQLLATVVVLGLAVRHLVRRDLAAAGLRRPGWSFAWAPMIAPALVLLSGITPYLGLGTDRALSMYSNLRTEGGRTNHLVVPAGAQVFPYQRDMVLIVASSVPRLQRLAERGSEVPYQELRAILTEAIEGNMPNPSVVYLRRGERHEVKDAGRDTTLGLPVSWLGQKLLRFRPVEARGGRSCGV